jgi:aerobic carbon-monoxide dehydrogenase small subunit
VSTHRLRFTVNDEAYEREVPAQRLLIDLLRDELGLTGTKEGCSIGVCGLCSVLVDGKLLSACLLPAVLVDNTSITTIEGIAAPDGTLSSVQEAFVRHAGLQCGICTPGQIIAATALLEEVPQPTEADIKGWMKGNLCRCTGYYKIIESIEAAAAEMDTPDQRAT